MLKLGIVTDEVYRDDFEKAIRFGVSRGIENFELRCAFGKRVPLFDNEQREIIKNTVGKYGVTLTGISPGIFKTSLYDEEIHYHNGELLDKSFDFAEEMGISKVIIFGVKRSESDVSSDYERVLNYLGGAAHKAKKRGLTLCVENEPGWWADTCENTKKILDDLSDTGIKLNLDPANFFSAGSLDCVHIYNTLKPYVANVHLKDIKITPSGRKCVSLGQGGVRWAELLRLLQEDGFSGNLSIETHCAPLLENTVESLEYVNKIINGGSKNG